jgi:hypothetical protein
MSPNQDGVRIGILLHSRLQALPQILFVRRVIDDGYPQTVVVAEVALLSSAFRYAFDLLNFFNLEACVAAEIALDEEGHEDGPLRVRVNAAASAAFEGGEEERRAGGGLENLCTSVHVV